MRLDFARLHFARHQGESMSRRDALRLGAAGATAVAVGTAAGSAGAASPEPASGPGDGERHGHRPPDGDYDDEMFDVEAVLAGAWVPGPYGPGDQRGSFNELTPERTADALKLLRRGRPVNTYQLGEAMFNGFPAFPSDPPRLHNMFLLAAGYQVPDGFVEGGGIDNGSEPIGPNLVSLHEERFAENFTFQIGTQVDGLGHVGVGEMFYNGFRGPDLATPTGLAALGNETMGPVVTRAVIYDVVGLKVDQGATDDFFVAPNGRPVLRDDYRISIDDLTACLHRQRVWRGAGAGEVPIMHTGWTHLVSEDPERYLAQEPGIYLAESRFFADRRVAMVATDTWGLEVLDPAVTGDNAFPCHQELFGKYGVRIGESFVTDSAIDDGISEGVLVVTPENVPGATCGSSAPVLLGQPGH